MTVTQSYNDADGHLSNPAAFREAYWRGARIWKDASKTIPRDCQKFFLAPGVAEDWSTLRTNLIRLPEGIRVGFRITDMDHVPDGWSFFKLNDHTYPNWFNELVWTRYAAALDDFKAETEFGQPGGVTWVDIPYIWRPSNEPSITDVDCTTIGGGNVAEGKKIYLALQKRMINLYVKKFGRAVVGNLGGPTWAREVLLPYAKSKGVRAFRQDSWMRFDWRGAGKDEGENRSSLYDESIAILGGRDEFDRLIPEQTGNGLTLRNGVIVDQGSGAECTVYNAMMGPNGEFYQLEATDYGNMGLGSPAHITVHPNAQSRYDAWYEYIGQPTQPGDPDPPPGDGGELPPVDPDVKTWSLRAEGGTIEAIYTIPTEDPQWAEMLVFPSNVVDIKSAHPPLVIARPERDFSALSQFVEYGAQLVLDSELMHGDAGGDRTEVDDGLLTFGVHMYDRFHLHGETSMVARFVYENEPHPDPDPTDPVEPPEYVPMEFFEAIVGALSDRISQLEAHNDSWADAPEGE